MTVAQNVAFGLENQKIRNPEKRERVAEMLELVELQHLENRYPRQLSGGQQQRVALARALAIRPAVLLLDEPFSNLDAQLRFRLREEMHALIKRVNITTLFVTHDQEEALTLADRVVVMNKGAVEQIGRPVDIYEKPETEFVANFIGWCSSLEGQLDGAGRFTTGKLTLPYQGAPGRATAIIRPEFVKLMQPGSHLPSFDASVTSSSYLGPTCRVTIDVSGHRLLMDGHFPGGLAPAPGEHINISIDPAGIRMIQASAGH